MKPPLQSKGGKEGGRKVSLRAADATAAQASTGRGEKWLHVRSLFLPGLRWGSFWKEKEEAAKWTRRQLWIFFLEGGVGGREARAKSLRGSRKRKKEGDAGSRV